MNVTPRVSSFDSNSSVELIKHETFSGLVPPGFKLVSLAKHRFRLHPDHKIEAVYEKIAPKWDLHSRQGEIGGEQETAYLVGKSGSFLLLDFASGKLIFQILSQSMSAVEEIEELVKSIQDMEMIQNNANGVWADFSYYNGDEGPRTVNQFLDCPAWGDIRLNYPADTRDRIQALMESKNPTASGRLVIWHGPPGCGKTYAIRSLMMAWRDRFKFIIVTDPERLASEVSYYYSIAERGEHDYEEDEDGNMRPAKNRKRTLFIMEDAADLVLQESRAAHFDKMGRLLNLTDGLFGQGRDDVFLFTFNEKVEHIDPAFLRPGRCIMEQQFDLFTIKGAEEWLRDHGCDPKLAAADATSAGALSRSHSTSLAQLYSILAAQRNPELARLA